MNMRHYNCTVYTDPFHLLSCLGDYTGLMKCRPPFPQFYCVSLYEKELLCLNYLRIGGHHELGFHRR